MVSSAGGKLSGLIRGFKHPEWIVVSNLPRRNPSRFSPRDRTCDGQICQDLLAHRRYVAAAALLEVSSSSETTVKSLGQFFGL